MQHILYFYYDSNQCKTVFHQTKETSFYLDLKPKEFLKQSCRHFGGSYQGAKESFQALTQARQKIPICVSAMFRIIYIPIYSEKCTDCVYIQYDRIFKVKAKGANCLVEFKNHEQVEFKCSAKVLRKQVERCILFMDEVANVTWDSCFKKGK